MSGRARRWAACGGVGLAFGAAIFLLAPAAAVPHSAAAATDLDRTRVQTETVTSASRTLPPGFTTTTATARCPAGFKVASGGGYVGEPGADKLLETYPASARGWTVRATRGAGASGDSIVVAYALCVDNLRVGQRDGQLDYGGGQAYGRSGVLCREGSSPLGAGFGFSNPGFDTSGALIGATPRNRRVTHVAFRQFNPDSYEVSAVCTEPRVRLERADITLPATGEPQTVAVRCPRGSKLVGGGAEGGDSSDVLAGSYPAGRQMWEAIGFRITGSSDSTLEATAVCMDR